MSVTLRTRWKLAVMLGVALATAFPVSEAAAGRGDKITATVNGHRVRFRRGQVCDGATAAGFSIVGAQKPHRLGQTLRGLALGCAIDVSTITSPVSPEFCVMGYTEIRFKPGVPTKQWGGSNPDIQITLSPVSGGRLQGMFSGTLQPESGSTAPATVTNGKFSVVLGGDKCTNPAQAE